ncbi:Protein serine/threonine kinase [Entamoeba marina]
MCDSSNGDCSSCDSGYYPSGTNCVACSTLDGNCQLCSSASQCTQCFENYYPSNSNCFTCESKGCSMCSKTNGYCTICLSGYYLSGYECLSCETSKHCVANSGVCNPTNGDCSQCISGYTLSGTSCFLCSNIDSYCSTCSQTSYECISCSDPYILSSDNLSCSLCPEGQHKNNETTCEYCYNSIDKCQLCSDGSTCTKCYEPYVISNGKCVLCQLNEYYSNGNCIDNTNTCNEQIDSTTCISCNSNNYLNEYQCYSQNECTTTSNYGCDECYNEKVITTNGPCLSCPSINSDWKYCIIGNENKCLECNDNYHLTSEGDCESIITTDNCLFEYNSKCRKCKNGFRLDISLNECIKCGDGCNICSYSNSSITNEECLQCNESTILTTTNDCIIDSNCIFNENDECIECIDNYYINNGKCTQCNNDNCKKCNANECILCYDNYLLDYDNNCKLKEIFSCSLIENGECIECNNDYELGNTLINPYCFKFEDEFGGCLYASVGELKCIQCYDEYIQFNGTCHKLINYNVKSKTASLIITDSIGDHCKYQTSKGCIKCNDGYYLESGLCYECSNGCETCYNSSMCLSCNSTSYVTSNNECNSIGDLAEVCKMSFPSNKGCAVCNDGYYKKNRDCIECDESCSTCIDSNSCLMCNEEYYQLVGESGLCTPYSELTSCYNKTITGCVECNNGTYLINHKCYSCKEECLTCSSLNTCLTCIKDYVLVVDNCIHYTTIDSCTEASNSKCTSCSGTMKVNNGVECISNGVIFGVTIPVLIIIFIILIIVIGLVIFFIWHKKRVEKKERENVCVFKMWRSNVVMERLTGELCTNMKILGYEGEIGVNEETRELICVGNTSKYQLKVQITTKKGCDKYEIRTNPQLITIKKGEACEFEIFIKPLCTCKIDDKIVIVALDIHKGEELTAEIGIKANTIMTTRLDYSELIEDIKLGEGSFGIVYKGTFRGNTVAIKKLKEAQDNDAAIKEFNKEVSMLDKFRNDYIVHFYGAVMIPNKICMVTEFAQYGSLHDLMKSHKDTAPRYLIKMKIILDCSKGISYLHSNGILHRDIKPDNFLILSLDNDVPVNAKLTDFGSSRNINMMMTNMTFTKGIGSPAYMAPEVLKKEKYKKSADVYSFAITMYEIMVWEEAYSKTKFKFPWKIAEFVTSGNRLSKPDTMNDSIFALIDKCWSDDLKKRYEIEEVVKKLEDISNFN